MMTWDSVENPLDVFMVLTHPPARRADYSRWEDMLTVEPPVWGSESARKKAVIPQARGFRVWSWNDYAVVYSGPNAVPPRGIFYQPWEALGLKAAS